MTTVGANINAKDIPRRNARSPRVTETVARFAKNQNAMTMTKPCEQSHIESSVFTCEFRNKHFPTEKQVVSIHRERVRRQESGDMKADRKPMRLSNCLRHSLFWPRGEPRCVSEMRIPVEGRIGMAGKRLAPCRACFRTSAGIADVPFAIVRGLRRRRCIAQPNG